MTEIGPFNRPGMNVHVQELSKEYRTGELRYPALTGITCEMMKGEMTIIQGPSGCGKTTFLNMLGGIDRPDAGSVRVGDRELGPQLNEAHLARYRLYDVGFVFQAYNLIPGLTALDNLQLPMTATR